MEKNKIKVLEAFSGIGAQRMALNRLGDFFEVVAISEIDEDAIKSYNAIHGKTINLGDISKVDTKDVPHHDLFTYTFPCTDISLGGKGEGFKLNSNTRSSLLWEAMRIIESHKPKYLFAENVINILSKKYKEDFDIWINHLDDIGYNTYYKKINARDFGIPQNRERAFFISIRKDIDNKNFKFPQPITLEKSLLDMLEEKVDDNLYIDDVVVKGFIYRDDGEPIIGNHIKIINATKTGYLLAKHGDGIDITYPKSKTRRGRVQDSRIQTLTTQHNHIGVLLCNSENPVEESFEMRFLSPLEYWRLMGISDDDYLKAKSTGVYNKSLYKQAGNAIVVDVMYYIFKQLLDTYNK